MHGQQNIKTQIIFMLQMFTELKVFRDHKSLENAGLIYNDLRLIMLTLTCKIISKINTIHLCYFVWVQFATICIHRT